MKLISQQSLVLVASEILGMRAMNLELIPILCCSNEIHQTTLFFLLRHFPTVLGEETKKPSRSCQDQGLFHLSNRKLLLWFLPRESLSTKSLSSADKEGDVQFGVSREFLEPSLVCKPYRTPPTTFFGFYLSWYLLPLRNISKGFAF